MLKNTSNGFLIRQFRTLIYWFSNQLYYDESHGIKNGDDNRYSDNFGLDPYNLYNYVNYINNRPAVKYYLYNKYSLITKGVKILEPEFNNDHSIYKHVPLTHAAFGSILNGIDVDNIKGVK